MLTGHIGKKNFLKLSGKFNLVIIKSPNLITNFKETQRIDEHVKHTRTHTLKCTKQSPDSEKLYRQINFVQQFHCMEDRVREKTLKKGRKHKLNTCNKHIQPTSVQKTYVDPDSRK